MKITCYVLHQKIVSEIRHVSISISEDGCETAQLVECLPHKHKELASSPRAPANTQSSCAYLWSQSWEGGDMQIPGAEWPASPALGVCQQLVRGSALKNKVSKDKEAGYWRTNPNVDLRPLHIHIHIWTYKCIITYTNTHTTTRYTDTSIHIYTQQQTLQIKSMREKSKFQIQHNTIQYFPMSQTARIYLASSRSQTPTQYSPKGWMSKDNGPPPGLLLRKDYAQTQQT